LKDEDDIDIESGLAKAVEVYNRYRKPEVMAILEGLAGRQLVVVFKGTMCSSCGGQDYMDDFSYEASDLLNKAVELVDFECLEDEGFRAWFRLGE
jgi:hypothetical protein